MKNLWKKCEKGTGAPDLMFKGVPIHFDKNVPEDQWFFINRALLTSKWAGDVFDFNYGNIKLNNPKASAVLTDIYGKATSDCLFLFGEWDGRVQPVYDHEDRITDPWSGQEYGRVGPDVFMVDPNVKGKYEVKEWTAEWKDIKFKAEGVNYFDHEEIKNLPNLYQEELARHAADMFPGHHWMNNAWLRDQVKKASISSTGS